MTREGDDGLYDDYSTASGWTKVGDMKARRMIMDDSKPQLVVSIHLNSFFSDESVHGAQIFYPTNGSPETVAKNETLARTVKELLKTELPNAGDRIILPKKDMFIFREAAFDGLLVECGFLSNPDDLNMLKDEEYQKRLEELRIPEEQLAGIESEKREAVAGLDEKPLFPNGGRLELKEFLQEEKKKYHKSKR